MSDDIRESIGELKAKTKAAHSRLDRLETNLREDLSGIYTKLSEIDESLNKGKGWAGAALLLAGIAGSFVAALVQYFMRLK